MEPISLVRQSSFNPDAKPFYPSSPPKQIKKEHIEIAPTLPEQKEETYKPQKYHSICIPRVDADVSKGYIFKVFSRMKIGWIEHIAEVPIKADPQFKRVFIKLKWNRTELANKINVRFDNGQNVKIVHSMPWYWICVSNAYSK